MQQTSNSLSVTHPIYPRKALFTRCKTPYSKPFILPLPSQPATQKNSPPKTSPPPAVRTLWVIFVWLLHGIWCVLHHHQHHKTHIYSWKSNTPQFLGGSVHRKNIPTSHPIPPNCIQPPLGLTAIFPIHHTLNWRIPAPSP